MSTTTTNLNLEKPAVTDKYNIEVFNSNMDIIDSVVKENQDIISSHSSVISQFLPTYAKEMSKQSGDFGWVKVLTIPNVSYKTAFNVEAYSLAASIEKRGHWKAICCVGTNNNSLHLIYGTNGINTSDFDYRQLSDGSYELWFHIPQYTSYGVYVTSAYGTLPNITMVGELGTPSGTVCSIY